MRTNCKYCDNLLVDGVGPRTSKILLLSSYPDYEDIKSGRLLSGDVRSVLNSELTRVGLQLSSLRYATVWQHGKNKECKVDWHIDRGMSEIVGKTHVLVMGSDASHALFGKNASDLYGLKMKHKLFPKVVFVVSPSASELFNSSLGEFYLAIETFSDTIKK